MMRKYINKESVLDIVTDCDMSRDEVVDCIEAIPSFDVAPVVRCKDCRWRDAEEKHHCIDINRVFDQMDFCSFGERKDYETI